MWHANILIPLTLNKKLIKVPIHFLIELPEDYPKNPPGVGFYCTFPYSMGASMAIPDGRLKGLFTLCLNILGNFYGKYRYSRNRCPRFGTSTKPTLPHMG